MKQQYSMCLVAAFAFVLVVLGSWLWWSAAQRCQTDNNNVDTFDDAVDMSTTAQQRRQRMIAMGKGLVAVGVVAIVVTLFWYHTCCELNVVSNSSHHVELVIPSNRGYLVEACLPASLESKLNALPRVSSMNPDRQDTLISMNMELAIRIDLYQRYGFSDHNGDKKKLPVFLGKGVNGIVLLMKTRVPTTGGVGGSDDRNRTVTTRSMTRQLRSNIDERLVAVKLIRLGEHKPTDTTLRDYTRETENLSMVSRSPDCHPEALCVYPKVVIDDNGNTHTTPFVIKGSFPHRSGAIVTRYYLVNVTEYVDGKPMDKYLKETTLQRALLLIAGGNTSYVGERYIRLRWLQEKMQEYVMLVRSVAYIHSKGVSHLDLKPSNAMVEFENDDPTQLVRNVKLIDFGAACSIAHQAECQYYAVSPAYAALEVLRHHVYHDLQRRPSSGVTLPEPEKYDPFAADVFSLGAVLFEILSDGFLIFRTKNYTEVDAVYDRARKSNTTQTDATLLFNVVIESVFGHDLSSSAPEDQPPRDVIAIATQLDNIFRACTEPDPLKRPEAKEIVTNFQTVILPQIQSMLLSVPLVNQNATMLDDINSDMASDGEEY